MRRRQPGQRVEASDAESADRRVVLRSLTEEDLHVVAPWYEGPQDLRRCLEEAKSDPAVCLLAITLRQEGRPIGVMEYGVGTPGDGWLDFRFVAVEPRLRGLGLDSEPVRLVEDDALKRGLARCFWAGVHEDDGLGLYFWLRLGYRPTRLDEFAWPEHRPYDIIAMVRLLENPEPRT